MEKLECSNLLMIMRECYSYRGIIESDEELNVVGTAKDGEEAYRVIKQKSRMSSCLT